MYPQRYSSCPYDPIMYYNGVPLKLCTIPMKIPSHWQAFVCLFEYIEQDAYFSFFNMLKEKHVEEVWSTGHFRVSGMGKCNMSSTTCQIFRPFSQPVHPHWGKVFVIHIIDMRSLTRKPSMIHICLTSFPSGHFSINIGV